MTSPSVLTPSPPFCHPERKRGVFFPFYPKQYEAFEDVFLGVYENEKVFKFINDCVKKIYRIFTSKLGMIG